MHNRRIFGVRGCWLFFGCDFFLFLIDDSDVFLWGAVGSLIHRMGTTSEERPTMLYTATCGADSHPPPRKS